MLEDYRLKVFAQVAQTGSFTKAAEALSISQPAVSQNVSELERQLGITLFERRRGEVALTEQGKLFLKYAERIIEDYKLINVLFNASSDDSVRLWISPEVRVLLSDRLIETLAVLRPKLKIQLVESEAQAEIIIFAISDKKRKDRQIKIEVTVLPENHPLAGLFDRVLDML